MVIQRTTSPDPTQVYVYEIRNKESGEVITASIKGIGHVIINDMPFAEYEITQLGGWSWRHGEQKRTEVDHSPEKLSSKMIENKEIRGTFVEFSELETSTLWLNGNSSLYKNKWGGQ